jgi:serine phosphatase RsbU (regulator of sigma subunit)
VLRGGGAAKTISVCGPALGLYPNLPYASRETCLGQGDILLLATDGITEARRPANHGPARPGGRAYLGLEGLARLARQSGQMEKASLVQKGQSIFDGARAFAEGTFHDDACLLIARREPSLAAI